MVEITDNFLNKNTFNHIKSIVLDPRKFNWSYSDGINQPNDGGFQFSNTLYDMTATSDLFNIVGVPLLRKMEVQAIARVRVNLITKSGENTRHGWHVDYDQPNSSMKTSIFYLTTSNGPTYFKDDKTVECIENRLVTFPTNTYHASSTQTDVNARIVFNINWF